MWFDCVALVAGDEAKNQTNSDSLQGENQTISDFIARTDSLAARCGLNLSEIPALIGISKAMLYGYRGGKNRITPKTWRKLEEAEKTLDRKANLLTRDSKLKGSDANEEETEKGNLLTRGTKLKGSTSHVDVDPLQIESAIQSGKVKEPSEEYLEILRRIANALEALVEQKEGSGKSSLDRGKKAG